MHPFKVLADPVRRRIVETLLECGPLEAGEIVNLMNEEFNISQPAISQQLKVLSDAGCVKGVRDRNYRIYSLEALPFTVITIWIDRFRALTESSADDR